MMEDMQPSGPVHILGIVTREDLLDLYVGARALVYVSYFGPENLPPLEAFGLGCPVIVSKVSRGKSNWVMLHC
jgi:glycosyltransferase involved in cell wall biosynthesis